MSAAQDGLHGAVVRGVVCEGALTGGLQACPAVAVGEVERALSSPQPLDDPIPEQLIDQCGAVGTYGAGPLETPSAIAAEELPGIGWQMIEHGASIAAAAAAQMHRH